MAEIANFIEKLSNHIDLSIDETARTFQILLLGGASPAQVASILMGMRVKGEKVEELIGATVAIRSRAGKLDLGDEVMDICGTGDEVPGLLNISTAASLVAAGAGVKVAKHGAPNGGVKASSGDVLQCLGVQLDMDLEILRKCLAEAGMCFVSVPKYLRALRNLQPVNDDIGIKTILNVVTPLSNPVNPKNYLFGVFKKSWIEPVVQVMQNTGTNAAWVVNGSDGMDEITITGKTSVGEWRNGSVNYFELVPEDFGIKTTEDIRTLSSGMVDYNAKALLNVLSGQESTFRNIVLMNAAASIYVYGLENDLVNAMHLAANSIDHGKAKRVLQKLVEITGKTIL